MPTLLGGLVIMKAPHRFLPARWHGAAVHLPPDKFTAAQKAAHNHHGFLMWLIVDKIRERDLVCPNR